MSKLRQWGLLTGVAVLVVLVAGWFLLVSPQRSHAANLRAQAAAQQTTNDQLAATVALRSAQQRGLPTQQALLAELAEKIPNNPALPSLIRELSAAADNAGVELVSIAPQQPQLLTPATGGTPGSTGGGGAATGATPAAGTLAEIGLTIQVSGSYFNIEQFFSNAENLTRSMLVTGFTLAPSATGSSSSTASASSDGAPDTLMAQISARVFMTAPASSNQTGGSPSAAG